MKENKIVKNKVRGRSREKKKRMMDKHKFGLCLMEVM